MTQAPEVRTAPARQMWPLYAAGFTTAFGAHGIAANLGGFSDDAVTSLMVLGGLLALYDGAEVLLKPVFGTLADRVGARPVLLGGLVAFAAASAVYAVADSPAGCGRRAWARAPPPPPSRPRRPRWSPASTRRPSTAGPSAVTASTSPSATPSARCSAGCWCGPGVYG